MDLNKQAYHIASTLVSGGRFPVYSDVLSNLLGWHRVSDFSHLCKSLGMSPQTTPLHLPVLQYLHFVTTKLEHFVRAHCAMYDVVTLLDLEEEATRMLTQLQLPSLEHINPERADNNPEEIDIDDIEGDDEDAHQDGGDAVVAEWGPFRVAFGLGEFCSFPSVEAMFAPIADPNALLWRSDVLSYLLEYTESQQQHSTTRPPKKRPRQSGMNGQSRGEGVDMTDFSSYLVQQVGVRDLKEVGVWIPRPRDLGLGEECQMMRRISAAKVEHHAEYLKQALNEFNHPNSCNAAETSVKADIRKAEIQDLREWELKPPTRPNVHDFIHTLSTAHSESDHHPSFAKLKRSVMSIVGDLSQDSIADILTEYGMLHLGGSKHRAKQWKRRVNQGSDESEITALAASPEEVNQPDSRAEATPPTETIVEPSTQASPSSTQPPTPSSKPACPPPNPTSPLERVSRRPAKAQYGLLEALRSDGGLNAVDIPVSPSQIPYPSLPAITDSHSIGRWGEALVYQLLLAHYSASSGSVVTWVNEHEETRSAYDLTIETKGEGTTFIEVKSTSRHDTNVFDISPCEWDFASKSVHGRMVRYQIFRVYGAGSDRCSLRVIRDLIRAVESAEVRLCLAV